MPVQHDTIAPHNSHHIAASAEIKESDAEYLAKHNIRALMADMVQEIVIAKPVSPVQFMIDYLAVGSSLCQQDKYGLSMMVASDDGLQTYLKKILAQLKTWLEEG